MKLKKGDVVLITKDEQTLLDNYIPRLTIDAIQENNKGIVYSVNKYDCEVRTALGIWNFHFAMLTPTGEKEDEEN